MRRLTKVGVILTFSALPLTPAVASADTGPHDVTYRDLVQAGKCVLTTYDIEKLPQQYVADVVRACSGTFWTVVSMPFNPPEVH